MTVTAVRKDPEALTMTIEAEFHASPERVWQWWADPRQLERWWGPPTYPATFTRHDLEIIPIGCFFLGNIQGYGAEIGGDPAKKLLVQRHAGNHCERFVADIHDIGGAKVDVSLV